MQLLEDQPCLRSPALATTFGAFHSFSPSYPSSEVGSQFIMGGAEVKVNVLTATCSDLQKLLTVGEIKSTDLVDLFLDYIEKHNHLGLELNAMISKTLFPGHWLLQKLNIKCISSL